MRAFLAITVPRLPRLVSLLEHLGNLGSPVRPVDSRQLHVTLKFLGSISPEVADRLAERLRPGLSECTAGVSRISGLGAFPDVARPAVVWAGFLESERLNATASRVEAVACQEGLPAESRPFHPHITLGRVQGRPSASLRDLIGRYANEHLGELPVEAVELIQSRLERSGPQYRTLARFPLPG